MGQTRYQKLIESVKAYEKDLTTRSFKGQYVYVHHEDGSYYIFQDSFMEIFNVGELEYVVVFSREIEPQIFFKSSLEVARQYGEVRDNSWEKEKEYKPKKIHAPVKKYLKKRKLTAKDFKSDSVLVRTAYTTMFLKFAFTEEDDTFLYIFTEHNGYYAIKKKYFYEVYKKE